ncbi:MAG TPA: hypothetical protein VE077_19765 [Candidatus Methylomirabilis sp.]|nr:hypothetical protein [Candidatus Methylomirabilis sp.]
MAATDRLTGELVRPCCTVAELWENEIEKSGCGGGGDGGSGALADPPPQPQKAKSEARNTAEER